MSCEANGRGGRFGEGVDGLLLVSRWPSRNRSFPQGWTGSPQPNGWNLQLLPLDGGHHHNRTNQINTHLVQDSVYQRKIGRASLGTEVWPMTCSNVSRGPALIYGNQPTDPTYCLHVRQAGSQMSIPMTTQGAEQSHLQQPAPNGQDLTSN